MSHHSNQRGKFQVNCTFSHAFRGMIDCGDAAKMKGTAYLVYSVIKSYVNISTGCAFPSIATISKKAGISQEQAKRCVKSIIEMGYVTKSKGRDKRTNEYRFREKVPIFDRDGHIIAVATWDYIPLEAKAAIDDLKSILKNALITGDFVDGEIVKVEKLKLPISGLENAESIKENMERIASLEDPELRQAMQDLFVSAHSGEALINCENLNQPQ